MARKRVPTFWIVTAAAFGLSFFMAGLKIAEVINWSWLVVLAPGLIYMSVMVIAAISALMTVSALVKILEEREKEEEEYSHGH